MSDMSMAIRGISVLNRIAERAKQLGFKLPGDPSKDLYCLPLSGGADSSALAIILCHLVPWLREKAVYTFTDTLAECGGLYDSLDRVEKYLGINIQRIAPEKGLFGLIEANNGFLPSARERWCTRLLKIKPWEKLVKSLLPETGGDVYTFIGIRADEPFRVGAFSKDPRIITESPFVELGITRDEVYQVLAETVGVPELYRSRTRSGCSSCWGQRRSEVLATLRWHPKEFALGKSVEKLSEEDLARYAPKALSVAAETGVTENHQTFPIPSDWSDLRQHRGRRIQDGLGTMDLFSEGYRDVFVAVEFFVHPGIGGCGVWRQDFVTFSPSRSGINRQLAGHYWHRVKTAEVFGLSPQQMEQQLKLVVYHLEVPDDVVSLDKTQGKSFAWRAREPYEMLEHVAGWVVRTLQIEGVRQTLAELSGAPAGSFRGELAEATAAQAAKIGTEVGRMIGMELYVPPECEPEPEEREVTCVACSI